MINRIQARIDTIQPRIDKLPADKVASLGKSLKTSWTDLVEYQTLQAAAHAAGKLTTEEATDIYRALGRENPTEEKWDKLPLATRVTITQIMAELIEWRLKQGPGFVVVERAIESKAAKARKVKGRPAIKKSAPGLRGVR